MAWIGAENIISPLGSTAEENFDNISSAKTGIQLHENVGLKNENLHAAIIDGLEDFDPVQRAVESINASLSKLDKDLLQAQSKCLLISTTKGDLRKLKGDPNEASLLKFKEEIARSFPEFEDVQLISNACISGVLSLIWAGDLIKSQQFQTVVVCGVDMLSRFTLSGFQSFFALADDLCKPFDKNRTGINLGEAASTNVLSENKELFQDEAYKFLGGSCSSDANHISGPSRTGEGLYRSVKRTVEAADVEVEQISFISAHGTGTAYNDEMESIAFDRMKLNEVPLNSLKGYFGHTFGAAGLVETAICLQSIRNNKLIASAGYDEAGTSKSINVLRENLETKVNTILKTASGFGGSNASILIQK